MTDREPIIRFVDVCKSFGSLRVFDRLCLDVYQGEILTIIGGSGCGKSVMLKLILGLLDWDDGRITVDGEDITHKNEDELLSVRQKVGMLFQNGALFDSLTVFDNIAYPLRERGRTVDADIATRIEECLQMVGLPGTETKMPSELSGGMRKRVALARAIAEEPKVILYDEPTTGLDPINVRRISELILSLKERLKITSIVVTHDLPSAFMVSDRMAMLADHHVIAIGPTNELQRSGDPRVQEFLNAMSDGRAA